MVSYQMKINSSSALLQHGKTHCTYLRLSYNALAVPSHSGSPPLQMLKKNIARSSSCSRRASAPGPVASYIQEESFLLQVGDNLSPASGPMFVQQGAQPRAEIRASVHLHAERFQEQPLCGHGGASSAAESTCCWHSFSLQVAVYDMGRNNHTLGAALKKACFSGRCMVPSTDVYLERLFIPSLGKRKHSFHNGIGCVVTV